MRLLQESRSVQNYRPDIDGIRAIAILSVVFYHAHLAWIPGGFTGVDIFFVISGYLIGGHVFSAIRSGEFSFLAFYKRRAKRILPAFYAVMVFTLLAALLLFSSLEAFKFAKWAIASVFAISNIFFALGLPYFGASSEFNPLLMTWSLGVEEQFYAVIPMFMVLLARRRHGLLLPAILLLCALSFAFSWHELSVHPSQAFFSLPSRGWELGVGVALAVAELRIERKLIARGWTQAIGLTGFALMLAPAYLLNSATPFPGVAALPSVLGAAMTIATPDCWVNRSALSFSPLVFIGRISYSWYLWHWPFLAFLRLTAGGELPPPATYLAVALSFAVAVLSYYAVEQPFRSSTHKAGPLLVRYAAASLLLAGIFAALFASHGIPGRYPVVATAEAEVDHPCGADYGIDKPDLSTKCYPTADARPAVALWGDSHAEALGEGLRRAASDAGYSFIEMGKSACLPLKGAASFLREHPQVASECIRFNDEVLHLLAADRRIQIVIVAGRWDAALASDGGLQVLDFTRDRGPLSPDELRKRFLESFSDAIQTLRNAGKRVIVIDDVPNFDFDPLCRFRTDEIPARRAMAAFLRLNPGPAGVASPANASAVSISTSLLRQIQEQTTGLELVELSSALCNDQNLCKYIDNGQLLYWDREHLTQGGARYALRNFRLPRPEL